MPGRASFAPVPAFAGPLVGFSLGVALAWAARRELDRDDERSLRRRLWVVALFAALVLAPVAAYFLVFAADWSLAYFLDARSVPSALTLILLVLDVAVVLLGFLAGRRALRRRDDRLLWALGAAPAGLALLGVLGLLRRLRIDGTYQQVHAAFGTQPVAGGPLGWSILWMTAMLVAGFVVAVRALTGRDAPPPDRAPKKPPKPPRSAVVLGPKLS